MQLNKKTSQPIVESDTQILLLNTIGNFHNHTKENLNYPNTSERINIWLLLKKTLSLNVCAIDQSSSY